MAGLWKAYKEGGVVMMSIILVWSIFTIGIIIALFLVQHRGTADVSAWFGPITLVWFLVMAAGGIVHVAGDPSILGALSPVHALRFLAGHGAIGLVVLGAVFLAVTGAEALYADLGHFGLGFYSAFMVADEVHIDTLSWQKDAKPVH